MLGEFVHDVGAGPAELHGVAQGRWPALGTSPDRGFGIRYRDLTRCLQGVRSRVGGLLPAPAFQRQHVVGGLLLAPAVGDSSGGALAYSH